MVEIEVYGVGERGRSSGCAALAGRHDRHGRGARPGAAARRPGRPGAELTQRAARALDGVARRAGRHARADARGRLRRARQRDRRERSAPRCSVSAGRCTSRCSPFGFAASSWSSGRSSSRRWPTSSSGRARGRDALYAALGAAVMGIWSSRALGGGRAPAQRLARHPRAARRVADAVLRCLLPITVAIGGDRIYSLAPRWSTSAFSSASHVHITTGCVHRRGAGHDPLDRAARLPLAVGPRPLSHGVDDRQPLEWPVWMICGFLIPLACFPAGCSRSRGCSRPPGECGAPRGDARDGRAWPDIAMCARARRSSYLVAGCAFLRCFLRSRARGATLALS